MDGTDEEAAIARSRADTMAALQSGSPEDWHRHALALYGDEPLDGLYWIVQQPDCDRATAHLIFWKGQPTGFDWETDEGVMGADDYSVAPMLRFIARRFNGEGYPRSEIAYDFLADHGLDMPEYAAMEKAARLRDIAALEARGQGLSPEVRLHPSLKDLTIPGRKVGLEEGEACGEAVADSPPLAPAAQPFMPPPPPPIEESFARTEAEEMASTRVRDLRRRPDEVPVAAPRGGAGGWFRRLLGR